MSTEIPANGRRDPTLWLPVAAALLYPWGLRAFHVATATGGLTLVAGAWLAIAFALPLSCLALVLFRPERRAVPARRLAFVGLTAPPLFVLIGVLAGLLHSPVKDVWIWSILWIGLGLAVALGKSAETEREARPWPRLRVAHGVAAVLILLFVAS